MAAITLFERIGGEPALTAAVESLYERVQADASIAPFFAGLPMETIKLHQRIFLTHVLGGPGQSPAADIRQAHARHRIEQRHFYAVSDHMVDALYALGVEEELIADVITLLAPLSGEIVNSPAPRS